jgi:beta-N-acetylhexosaminidase
MNFNLRMLLVCVLMAVSGEANSSDAMRLQIGQMVMMGFKGTSPEDPGVQVIAKAISEGSLGGVILYGHNILNPDQLKKLTEYLQNLAPAGQPLFIAVDQEGGKVQRLTQAKGFMGTMSAYEIGKRGYDYAYLEYQEMAYELRFHGINWNLGPVVDLALNKNSDVIVKNGRSFARHATVVTELAKSFIRGHQLAGVLTAVKHWPGHGSAAGDSHHGIVDVTDTWKHDEILPYEKLIAENLVDAVMTAHVFHREFDEEKPATMSYKLIQVMLRDNYKFDGVVMTDCMQMGAVTALVGNRTEDAALEAILAGADIMLLSNYDVDDYGFPERLLEKVKERAAQDGGVVTARLEESNRRIAMLKQRLGGKGPEIVVIQRDEL